MATKKSKVMVDCRVVIEPTHNAFWPGPRTVEERAKTLESWARELTAFFRDHRSQDVNSVSVECDYEDQCSACGHEWEIDVDTETGQELCAWCGETIESGDLRKAEATER